MSAPVIALNDVSRRFGKVQALERVSLSIPQGSVVGLLGTNGAGKSTLMRLIMGYLYPDTGSVQVFEANPRQHDPATLQRVAFVSDGMRLPGRMTLREALRFNRQCFPKWNVELETQLTEEFDVDQDRPFSRLSLGQKKRAMLLQAVCQGAELLVLDEPLSGLDAIFRRQCLDMLLSGTVQYEQTILISSHLLHDVERIVDRVAMMVDGRIFHESDLEDLKSRMRRVRVAGPLTDSADSNNQPLSVIGRQTIRDVTSLVVDNYSDAELHSYVHSLGDDVRVEHMNLEDIFVELAIAESSPVDGESK